MIIVALGQQGMGKTHGLCVELQQLVLRRRVWLRSQRLPPPYVFVHDLRAYYNGPAVPTGAAPAGDGRGGHIMARTLGSLVPRGHWWDSPRTWRAARAKCRIANNARVIGFHDCDAEAVAQLGADCLDARVPAVLCIDELDHLPHNLRACQSAAFRVLQHGRRTPVDLLGTFRRPAHVDKALLTEANVALLYRLRDASGLDAIRRSGWPGAIQLVRQLPRLKPRQRIRLDLAPDLPT